MPAYRQRIRESEALAEIAMSNCSADGKGLIDFVLNSPYVFEIVEPDDVAYAGT